MTGVLDTGASVRHTGGMTTTKQTSKQRNIVASLRDQRLDVHLGFITRDEWARRIRSARDEHGCILSADLAAVVAEQSQA